MSTSGNKEYGSQNGQKAKRCSNKKSATGPSVQGVEQNIRKSR